MAQTAGALADDVRQLAAPINWARRYPKTAVGVAVAAGAMVGIMAGRQPKRPAAAQAQPANPPPPADKAKTTLLGMLMVELLAIAKPMISELLTRAVKSPDRQHDNDGN